MFESEGLKFTYLSLLGSLERWLEFDLELESATVCYR